jgi:hypothetical protein
MSSDVYSLVGWSATLLLFLIILPLIYVFVRSGKGENGNKFLTNPTSFLRQHPRDILILAVFCGLPCMVVLAFFQAPSLLLITLEALMVSSFAVALLNLFYRVSYHLTAITVLVVLAVVAWGRIVFISLALIPLVSWAKYRLGEHNLAQMAIAIILSIIITAAMLYFLG